MVCNTLPSLLENQLAVCCVYARCKDEDKNMMCASLQCCLPSLNMNQSTATCIVMWSIDGYCVK